MPRAAHEKIAADIGYHFGLPIPPVTLWDRGRDAPDPQNRYVAISAWAFPGAEDWTKIHHLLPEAAKKLASRVFAAMLPFEAYRQIAAFRQHFSPELIQLVENRRCPPEIVQAANNLVAHNSERTPGKAPLVSTLPSTGPAIRLRVFQTDKDEAGSIASEIAGQGATVWGKTAILGRTRAILQPVLECLRQAGVPASIATRRDRFVSPQFVWLQSCLDQSLRPTDKQVFTAMAGAANRIACIEVDAALLAAEAESSGAILSTGRSPPRIPTVRSHRACLISPCVSFSHGRAGPRYFQRRSIGFRKPRRPQRQCQRRGRRQGGLGGRGKGNQS